MVQQTSHTQTSPVKKNEAIPHDIENDTYLGVNLSDRSVFRRFFPEGPLSVTTILSPPQTYK